MSKNEISLKIKKNLKELKTIIELIENNQSREKVRYLVNLARIYLYETTLLISNELVDTELRSKATIEITQLSTVLNPLSVLNQRNSLRIS